MKEILSLLPQTISSKLLELPVDILQEVEEIRIRIGKPVEILHKQHHRYLHHVTNERDAQRFMEQIAEHSFYRLEEELKRGYLTIPGGHRIGLAGKVILQSGEVKGIREVSSFNIRVARQKIGTCERFVPSLFDQKWKHTMIIGPPQSGKTTLLRDLARFVSSGNGQGIPSFKVGIVDERSEIAGCVKGVPQLELGNRVDVLDGCPKVEGMMMLIRSMSPDVLVVDEIGRKEDGDAILEAVNAGVTLMMSIHGSSLQDVKNDRLQRKLLSLAFSRDLLNYHARVDLGQLRPSMIN